MKFKTTSRFLHTLATK